MNYSNLNFNIFVNSQIEDHFITGNMGGSILQKEFPL